MKIILFLLGLFAVMTGTFFGSAGRWDLPLAWVCLGVYAGFMVLAQLLMDPELRRERMKPAPGGIDRQIRWAMLPFILGYWVVAGLDIRRHGSEIIPHGWQVLGLAGSAASLGLALWALTENRFFSPVVRVQTERGHHLITSGPYQFIRHPGYLGSAGSALCGAIALGSWWALLPAVVWWESSFAARFWRTDFCTVKWPVTRNSPVKYLIACCQAFGEFQCPLHFKACNSIKPRTMRKTFNTRPATDRTGARLWLLIFLTLLSFVPAQSAVLAPGTTVLTPLTGQAATNQTELLAKLRRLPKEIPSEARTFTDTRSSRGVMRYRLYKPLHFDPVKTYPLVLSLHGGGPRRKFDDLLEPFNPGFAYGIGRLVSPDTQSKHPAFVVVPWSAGSGWDAGNIRLVMGILDSVRAEFKIDPKRLYVTGQSMGGSGTWAILEAHPNVFAAAIPICGWGETATAKKIKDIPVWAMHGNADTIMPVAGSRAIVKALLEAGGKPIYWEYDGATHALTAERAYCEPLLIDWLFAQIKR